MEQNEEAVPPPDKTLAIHPALWAIELELHKRQPLQVIRFRGKAKSTKLASQTTPIITHGENRGAVPPWSGTELDIHGVSKAELAVVVGVLVTEELCESARPGKKKTQGLNSFSKDEHPVITPKASMPIFYVVRPLNFKRTTLYILYDYSDSFGLCEIRPLSSGFENCVLFFEEWLHDYADSEMKKRHDKIKKNITAFAQKYIKDNESDFTDAGLASARSKSELQNPTRPPASSLAFLKSSIQGALSAYEITGDAAYMNLIKEKLVEIDRIS
ncbi:hypothetical protein H9Q69_013010 [Fusarium xylarioides]|uniref:Uncharacterized protein n=1 Tax=Fusarium xylarioides TaxID=221167 RepID=A0A9P7IF76_9HYPO|nr:hypothetical protein H9Q70_012992 [Fusarium xylarioides]KAG5758852.1 hypothetical protein H9Q72_013015 [Fusarium xylarioides]KAG5771645.1 hypothetical protein H9Q73_012791 [Fusarium xylarioides]KAG5787915.1 hypothetical protein H9Q69_013010 [Fusarium xylarioides]KAG5803486.1 hypothetical protein H9Q71_011927 [Fusarium xylarioides]